ncbi:MAG: radical SAM protein [Candidatus Contendobacter sp.]|nr:radical SAM protein [Candidatus Contendobacter sp.]
MDAPGYPRLKLEILRHGIFPSDAAIAALPSNRGAKVVVRDYPTTSGLILRLPGDLYANARLRPDHPEHLPLDHDGARFVLRTRAGTVPVDVLPPPRYALESRRLRSGKSIRMVAMTHADRVRLTPLHGCAYHCQFCNYPPLPYRQNTVEELAEALEIALADRILPHPHVLISGGTPRPEEQEYAFLNQVYASLLRRFPTLKWDLMLAPRTLHAGRHTRRTYDNFVQRLREWGFDALSVNLELNSPVARQRHIPEKDAIGRENYLLFMELAVEHFGPGKVRSVLLVGLEPEEETLRAVDDLARRGVLVELSPFTADPGIFLARHPEPTVEGMESVRERAMELAERLGAPMRPFCVPCSHNIL